MNMKKTTYRTLTLIILSLLVISTLSVNTTTAEDIDLGDGIFTDSFENSNYIQEADNLENIGGAYTLDIQTQRTYDFTNTEKKQAYSFKTIFFSKYFKLQPNPNILGRLFVNEFSISNTYKIQKDDNNYYETSSLLLKNKIAHHFRLQLDVDSNLIGQLNLQYNGRVDLSSGNSSTVDLKIYYYSSEDSQWKTINDNYNAKTKEEFQYEKNLTNYKNDILDDNNYIDILILAPMPYRGCWLQSDYIEITATGVQAYSTEEGTLTGKKISPKSFSEGESEGFYWDVFTWDDSTRTNAEITYQLHYINKNNDTELIPDAHLQGNSEGFTKPPISLSNLPTNTYKSLIPKATLNTNSPSYSPQLKSWTFTWQTPSTEWNDHFNSTARIENSNKILSNNGYLTITPIQGDWPQHHANTENSRHIDVTGPKSANLHWLYEQSRYEFSNPVINDGYLYINIYDPEQQESYLKRYTILAETQEPFYDDEIKTYTFEAYLGNSPAITDEGNIIVATGDFGSSANTNQLYCFDKNLNLLWESDSYPNTCFSASPTYYDGNIYITTWDGNTASTNDESNQLYIIDSTTGAQNANISLPEGSYSKPAITDTLAIVSCDSSQGNSLLAINLEDNAKAWNVSLGGIGYSSPVIDSDNVYIIHKTKTLGTRLTALTLNNGTQLWQISLNTGVEFKTIADSTPTLYNDTIYVCTPAGQLKALNTSDGGEQWSKDLEDYSLSTQSFTLSPSYADGLIYIGTPSGNLYALYSTTGTTKWTTTADYYDEDIPAYSTSPVISNGLLFIADEAGRLYSIGSYQEPVEGISGTLTSIPITRPEGTWWGIFNANYTNTEDSNISFSILDKDGTLLRTVQNGNSINTLDVDTIKLQASLTAKNISNNPELHSWGVSYSVDDDEPVFFENTLRPSGNNPIWSNEVIPEFSIQVQDNNSGLVTNEATYTIWCSLDFGQIQQKGPFFANLTGTTGTTQKQTLIINLTEKSFYNQITAITKINITVLDRAGKSNTYSISIHQDTGKPSSTLNTEGLKDRYNDTEITLTAEVDDPELENEKSSGIDHVDLYYKYSTDEIYDGDWILYGANTNKETSEDPEWAFRPQEGGGYYLLCSIAIDTLGNVEDFPNTTEDLLSILFDNEIPARPSFNNPYWSNERPTIPLTFTDDYQLSSIFYKTEMTTTWTTLAEELKTATYSTQWTIDNEDWISINEGSLTNIHFKIVDALGNTRILTGSESLQLGKDTLPPQSVIKIANLDTEYTWKESFVITADSMDIIAGSTSSGVNSVTLYYRFDESQDGIKDKDWVQYNDTKTQSPYEWDFKASDGNGYYDFKVEITDSAGNQAESEVFQTGVNVLPTVYLAAILALVIVLTLITLAIIITWKPMKNQKK